MSKTTIKLPKWLVTAIKKYSLASVAELTIIFEAYFEENTVDNPRFEKLVLRLLKRKSIKQRFFDVLDAQGRFDLEDEDEATDEDEPEADEDEDDDTAEDDDDADDDTDEDEDEATDEDEDDSDEDDSDEDEATDEDEDDDTSEDDDDDDSVEVEDDEPEEELGYDATGTPTLEEVTELVSTEEDSFGHIEEFEDPSHLLIAAQTLKAIGFDVSFDSRCGGTVKRPRGGKFQLEIDVLNKKAVKRRGKVAPVFAFTDQIIADFDEQRSALIEILVDTYTTDQDEYEDDTDED